ncbi:BTAD domain-containing putative transcriptional regulator [Kitasatospora sp. NPDC057541]|uniref:AfsR/SARP family transcriptional regulator n=1 Tax=unclassified Kitasatospora TaxID=2633591 RepID=UPI0036A70D07
MILAKLMLRAGNSVPASDLMTCLWDEVPPPTAKEAFYVHLMRLRKEMARTLGAADGLLTGPGGYRLDIDPADIDVFVFRRTVREAQAAERRGDPSDAVALLRQAETLWSGPALADVPSDLLRRGEGARLDEERAQAVERRTDLELAMGHHTGLVAELRALTARHPSRERLWGQLMLALYRDSRQAEALDCYRHARTILREGFGLEPGDELGRLHHQILQRTVPPLGTSPASSPDPVPAPAGGLPTEHGTGAPGHEAANRGPAWVAQCQLPPDTPDFVGRGRELRDIEQILLSATETTAVPVAVLSGPPGVGKSALAVRVAHRMRSCFPDGQWYVHLPGTAGRPDAASDALADLLRLTGTASHSVPEGQAARAAALRARLADRRVLLIIDGAGSLEDVLPLLPGGPDSAVLVTSRRVLTGLPGALQVRLTPLTATEAGRFLAALVGDRAEKEPDAAGEIAALCGHLPLALRIAGARAATRPEASLSRFAHRLRDRQRLLDELRADSMHLRASMELSYTGLSEQVRSAFRALGLLDGSAFPDWVLAALVGHEQDADPLIEELVGASLIMTVGHDRTGEPCYRMHDLLHVYASDLAASDPADDRRAALRRLLDALLQIGSAAHTRHRRIIWGRRAEPSADDASSGTVVVPGQCIDRLTADPLAWDESVRQIAIFMVERSCELGWYTDAHRLAELVSVTTPLEFQRMYGAVLCAARAAGDELLLARAQFAQARLMVDQRAEASAEALQKCLVDFERMGADYEACHVLVWLSLWHTLRDEGFLARRYAARAQDLAGTFGADAGRALAVPEFVAALGTDPRSQEPVPAFERVWPCRETAHSHPRTSECSFR